ncbi:HAD family phosphatase [uncultured Bacteroides sp.]|uniref:HAD family hydrolase n=1 Tax=uncultured Bacteroides sp. TaxID=162156 RepID=UPI0023BBE780|nr:HAD family hydrolase [uncultured Bacteroides sp.]MDE5702247.1 HAD family hydrolase [Bacteroides sp.]
MAETKSMAALFDFDGVVVDTETQYSVFWHKMGVDYLGMEDLEKRIKGQTLVYIYDTFFSGMDKEQQEITIALDRFEREMSFDFIPGVEAFVSDLRRNHVRVAVVTSSNDKKMEVVYRAKPEIRTMFDHILTAEMFTASKPAPDCFLLGMKVFGTTPETTYVFEDSFNGLKAGMASGATVVGLATTNPRPEIAPLCHHVLNDFEGFTYDKLVGLHK